MSKNEHLVELVTALVLAAAIPATAEAAEGDELDEKVAQVRKRLIAQSLEAKAADSPINDSPRNPSPFKEWNQWNQWNQWDQFSKYNDIF